MKNAALITTCNHNIGDDMVREGILYLLAETGNSYRADCIHKHFPVTVRARLNWLQTSGISGTLERISRRIALSLSRSIDRLPSNAQTDKILRADVLIQCGAPVYWCFGNGDGAHRNEWYGPLMKNRYASLEKRIPFLIIGAGSCQPYGDSGSVCSTNEDSRAYIMDLHSMADRSIVRDPLAGEILSALGLEALLLPCPSLFARDRFGIDPGPVEYVAVNFMPRGGHYLLGQQIRTTRWRREFGLFLRACSARVPLVLACHNREEHAIAGKYFSELPRRHLHSVEEALHFYSRAGGYIGSRVHGAMAVASFGRPAFVVGNDTRVRTVEPIGCSHSFVEQTDARILEMVLSRLVSEQNQFAGHIERIREETCARYCESLRFLKNSAVVQDS